MAASLRLVLLGAWAFTALGQPFGWDARPNDIGTLLGIHYSPYMSYGLNLGWGGPSGGYIGFWGGPIKGYATNLVQGSYKEAISIKFCRQY